MNIIEQFRTQAKKLHKTIVLPEGEESRVIEAASFLESQRFVKPILLGRPEEIRKIAGEKNVDISGIDIIDPQNAPYQQAWSEKFYQMRQHKGLSKEDAQTALKNPLYYAAFLLHENMADGAVAGSINTTGNVLRAGIQVLGLAEKVSVVSSSFIMALKDNRILTFADCAVIPNPDAQQLASIAISSANTHERLVGETPRIAMLSFSTKGSAAHDDVNKVIEATRIIKETSPGLQVDGELQFDAAFVPAVGSKKAPGSDVAGKANVFIFPDLDAGNIGYKIAQRIGGAEAIGPVIQGLKRPYNDLSRGCSVEDVINVACICALIS